MHLLCLSYEKQLEVQEREILGGAEGDRMCRTQSILAKCTFISFDIGHTWSTFFLQVGMHTTSSC